jgi:predicted DNA binding CopG/RHH family protein
MKAEYDFSKSIPNPYTKKLKKQVTIRLDVETIEYFKKISEETGIPYQNLINLYLMECATKHKKPDFAWK